MWPFSSPISKLSPAATPAQDEVDSKNIWFPLAGPPRTAEEQARLKSAIDEEHEAIIQEFSKSSQNKLDVEAEVERVAKENCADLTLEWRSCLKSLTTDRFFKMCSESHDKLQKCVSIQTDNLYRLGYHKEYLQSTTDETTRQKKLEAIQDVADEMYLQYLL